MKMPITAIGLEKGRKLSVAPDGRVLEARADKLTPEELEAKKVQAEQLALELEKRYGQFKCEYCDYKGEKQAYLDKHMKLCDKAPVAEGESSVKVYACVYCHKESQSKADHFQHLWEEHKDK